MKILIFWLLVIASCVYYKFLCRVKKIWSRNMGKRKAENELTRFVWKRNPLFDINLLNEVESFNPYSHNNQKQLWEEVAQALFQSALNMKVTGRSCRERTSELLKIHRRGELASIRSSGTSAEQLTTLETLLINVAKLEEAKPNKQLKSLYSTKDKEDAEAERSKALEEVDDSSSDDERSKNKSEDEKDDFKFDSKPSRFQTSNPKNKLVQYLEKKNEKEIVFKKEEIRIRNKEFENKTKELEIKAKELELNQFKAAAEAEERKAVMELLVKLATKPPQ